MRQQLLAVYIRTFKMWFQMIKWFHLKWFHNTWQTYCTVSKIIQLALNLNSHSLTLNRQSDKMHTILIKKLFPYTHVTLRKAPVSYPYMLDYILYLNLVSIIIHYQIIVTTYYRYYLKNYVNVKIDKVKIDTHFSLTLVSMRQLDNSQ